MVLSKFDKIFVSIIIIVILGGLVTILSVFYVTNADDYLPYKFTWNRNGVVVERLVTTVHLYGFPLAFVFEYYTVFSDTYYSIKGFSELLFVLDWIFYSGLFALLFWFGYKIYKHIVQAHQ